MGLGKGYPMKLHLIVFILVGLMLLSACQFGGVPATPTVPVDDVNSAGTIAPATEAPTEPPADETKMEESGLPADPQRMEFQAEDGLNLVGYYYPSKYANAPIVVLMHWAGGDQTDWPMVGMVQWLQNRPDENPIPEGQEHIYPSMPEDVSFAVFTFDFRGYGESDPMPDWDPEGLLMDAKAAYATAQAIPDIDPTRMAGLGSSNGADAVVDTCGEGCLGCFSLSPGSYLNIDYTTQVQDVLDPAGKPAWCVASEEDPAAYPTCNNTSGENFKATIYPGNKHGTQLLIPPDDPEDIGQVIFDWLVLTFGITP